MSDESPADKMYKSMSIQQGYIPKTCTLPGQLVWLLVNKGEDPCAGCNENRNICGGRPRLEDYNVRP